MSVTECWPLFLLHTFLSLLLSALPTFNPSLAYSLRNCTVDHVSNETQVECNSRELVAVPDDIPQHATCLELRSNLLSKITRVDLRGLSKLRSLDTGNNMISQIDDGAFAHLEELKSLKLDFNQLSNLTGNMFEGLKKLTYLSLNMNMITSISPEVFQSLTSLQILELSSTRLHQMKDIVPILQLKNINELYLDGNSFTRVLSDDLPLNKSNLRTLSVLHSPLRKVSITRDVLPHLRSFSFPGRAGFEWDVPDTTFLRSLRDLTLSEASFEIFKVMQKSFKSVQKIHLLKMTNKPNHALVDLVCQLPALRSLDLSDNDFGLINDTLLQSCSKMTELNLSRTKLEKMSEFSLRPMKQLRGLQLQSNKLTRVPPAIRGLSTLKILDLSQNEITELGCSDFLNLTLTELNLSQNHILALNGRVFRDLSDLKVLNMSLNPIYKLEDFSKVNLQRLEVFDFHGNSVGVLETGDFRNLPSLRYLDLESEKFYFVNDGAFEGLNNLQTLSITPYFNGWIEIKGILRLQHLKLHMIYFHVPKLHPDIFKSIPHLTSLQITHSHLKEFIPELFWPIPNLQDLDLSRNQLRSLDFLARVNLSALSRLVLRQNRLTVIDQTVFQSLPALTYLDLFGNPFNCNCSNAGFIQWVKSNIQPQVVNAYQYECSFPIDKQGTKLMDFDIQSCFMDYGFLCFISTTCLVVLTLLTSFIYHFLRWQLAFAFHLFLAFVYDTRKRRKGTPYCYDAFVSYNVHDEDWVYQEMLPVLEGEQGWRLCLHHRDFQPGKPIIENITDAIYGSRKTICVISRHYLQSEWCSREIQMASFRLFDEQKDVLILLFLEEIPAQQLSPYYRMRKLVKRRTYLSWPQAGQHPGVFWQSVQRALKTGDTLKETAEMLTGPAGC